MSNVPQFKVGFGREARTVVYEDAQGKYIFTFDLDVEEFKAKGTSKKLFLDPGPGLKAGCSLEEYYAVLESQTQRDRERVALMKERVKQYLISLGYDVEVV
ncbi:MAG: hypothetical protein HZA90_18775 [Verrucomicrobia bacterium]|nr:hypothetical protein [Verrucomicrobiota bacterium]